MSVLVGETDSQNHQKCSVVTSSEIIVTKKKCLFDNKSQMCLI